MTIFPLGATTEPIEPAEWASLEAQVRHLPSGQGWQPQDISGLWGCGVQDLGL